MNLIVKCYWFEKAINTGIQHRCVKLIKSDSKDIYNVTKNDISNKCCSFALSVQQRILKNKQINKSWI